MEITPNSNIEPAARAAASQVKARAPQPSGDTAAFDRAEALSRTLQTTPLVRPDVVEIAREYIGDVKYPPEETIRRIAVLLATQLDHATDVPA
jgi:hypothetical protein